MERKLILKSMAVWFGILPLAILNGALREYVWIPLFGSAAKAISGFLLCGMIFFMLYLFISRFGVGSPGTYRKMGIIWILSTVIFETFLGMLMGESFLQIIKAYNIFSGDLWLFVVIFIGFAPWLAAKGRRII